MRSLKEILQRWGKSRHEGASEGKAKRRAFKPGSEEWYKMDRPGSLVRVIGFISPSPGQLKQIAQ